uniref:Antennal gustatory receptor 1 n=1 Tax=Dendrolimus punctatus TaxID=238572 RepID=A0A2K8GKX1_9NEOP|nr:antennal gustatory receptor 1 [Dendrolimus punctatus]
MMNKKVPLKSVNNLIDTIGFIKTKPRGYIQGVTLQTRETTSIRCLALSYSEICGVVKEIDESFGFIILLLLGSFLFHLVITPYNLIESLSDASTMAQLSKIYESVCLQFAWCVFHTGNLIVTVEPCHRTITEVAKIKELVSKLMRSSTTTHDHDVNDLNLFYKHLLLREVCYAPLQVCTLNRALVATIMGNITTYLVVLFQM